MWIYEGGQLLKNDLADELLNDTVAENCLTNIQRKYDSLLIDDGNVFAYKGFRNKAEKEIFEDDIKEVVNKIKSKLSNRYDIVQKIDFS
jgi:TolB-like protein